MDTQTDYYDAIEECIEDYMYVMNKVRENMYGAGGGNYSNLPGTCIEQVRKITEYVIAKCAEHEDSPEYLKG